MNAMQPPQSIEEIKAGLETTEKGGVRQSIRNCLTVFQRDPLLSGAIAYNILTDRKDIIGTFMKRTRMEAAAELLRSEPTLSVGEIASLAGYENQGKFSGAFKSVYEMTPIAYRLKYS